MKRAVLHIEGMSCGHCLNAVRRALSALPGVEIGTLQLGRAEVRYDARLSDGDRIAAAVADAGYRATLSPTQPGDRG